MPKLASNPPSSTIGIIPSHRVIEGSPVKLKKHRQAPSMPLVSTPFPLNQADHNGQDEFHTPIDETAFFADCQLSEKELKGELQAMSYVSHSKSSPPMKYESPRKINHDTMFRHHHSNPNLSKSVMSHQGMNLKNFTS
jgi:hypothetical protein